MYNGIGLTTVRGSATSGHVTKNMSHVKPEFFRNKLQANASGNRSGRDDDGKYGRGVRANPEILDHIRKREVEAKLYAARDEFEGLGYTEVC
jgi:serine/arginine repetitive matrix protein 2